VVPSQVDAFTGERIPLQPVRRVHVTTLVDNMLDVLAAWPQLPVAVHQDKEGSTLRSPSTDSRCC